MINEIKTYIIHFLGGYTKDEYKLDIHNSYKLGRSAGCAEGETIAFNKYKQLKCNEYYNNGKKVVINSLIRTMNKIYGCSEQEWIDTMYNEIINYN